MVQHWYVVIIHVIAQLNLQGSYCGLLTPQYFSPRTSIVHLSCMLKCLTRMYQCLLLNVRLQTLHWNRITYFNGRKNWQHSPRSFFIRCQSLFLMSWSKLPTLPGWIESRAQYTYQVRYGNEYLWNGVCGGNTTPLNEPFIEAISLLRSYGDITAHCAMAPPRKHRHKP